MPEFKENPRPRPPDPYEGRVIDKYMLISKLGTGGMGLVYRAEQVRIKRQVAIKLLSAKLIHDQVNVKRIEREAAAMGNLRHPNIATFHDFGISDGQPYLVMELIAGRSLGDILDEQKRIEPERAITIAAQVADAMAYAHKQGLVHRDLKPDNIMLDNEHTNDFAKVLDFGIAKTAEDLSLTKSGVLIGSPLYMSPEQCRGSKLDARSDIYSLGVIIYEAVTGLVPCKGETLIETLSRKTMEQAPPFPPEFSEWKDLERLTLACLATEPEDRPQSMTIVRDELFNMVNPGSVSMSLSSLQRPRGPRSTGNNSAMDSPAQTQGGSSTQSRIGARRPARSTQSRTGTGPVTQSQTQSQLQGHPPVLDETGQIYKPVVSSNQMIIIGTTIGAIYLMSIVAVAAWYVGFDEGNGPNNIFGGAGGASSANNSTASVTRTDQASNTSNSQNGGTTDGAKGFKWGWKQNKTEKADVAPTQPVADSTKATPKPPAPKPEIKVVKTVVKPKHHKTAVPEQAHQQPVPTYRYGTRNDYSNANADVSNYDAPLINRNGVSIGRNVRIRQAQIEAEQQAREQLKQLQQAAAEERAAVQAATAAARAGNRRINDLDAARRQYGGGSQWGKDTGSSYYGNGNF